LLVRRGSLALRGFLTSDMRFVQFADVHLDSAIAGALRLPPEKRDALRRDIRASLTNACRLATQRGADLVLIPGDLFDYESLERDTFAFLKGICEEIAPVRVFITPGNHDSLRPNNPYADAWPANVHVFKAPEFTTVVIDDLDCGVTGIAHAHRGITDHLLARPIERTERPVNILLFHGSREGFRPSEKENVIPFSDQELVSQGFTYAGIGHYHTYAAIDDASGGIRAAYSGCAQGRGLDETGQKCALVGEIDSNGRVTLEQVEVAPRRIQSVEVEVTGSADAAGVTSRAQAAAQAAGVRECDIARVTLVGTLARSIVMDLATIEGALGCFHAVVSESALLPDYDLDALGRESAASPLKSAFVQRMNELSKAAKTDDERSALRDATYYGLYALDGRRLEPRDED
jgi:DNA repair protein SbcD/Mre11